MQTIELGEKTSIVEIDYMSHFNKCCFFGSRVNVLDFDSNENRFGKKESVFPIRVEYNPTEKEIIVCTRRDIR